MYQYSFLRFKRIGIFYTDFHYLCNINFERQKFMKNKIILFFSYSVYLIFCYCTSARLATFYSDEIYSDAAYVENLKTNTAILEKNADKKRSPASLTKIMTFIVAYEKIKNIYETKVVVPQEVLDKVDPESSGVKLKPNEEISVYDLMQCMLICSSGDAAMVLGHFAGDGNISEFVNQMNEKSKELGCKNTNFMNPDGFYDENQYSTAKDIFKIAKYAMNIPIFAEIVSKVESNIFNDERDPIVNTNKMMDPKNGGEYYCSFVKGIKTGYLSQAGRCLASFAQINGNTQYIGVIMGGPTVDKGGKAINKNYAMIDTKNIYNWASGNLKTVRFYKYDSPISQINLDVCWESDKLFLFPKNDIYISLPKNFEKDKIELKTSVPKSVDAGINPGDVLGKADIFYNGQLLKSFDLIANEKCEINYILVAIRFLKNIFTHPLFLLAFFISMIILYRRIWVRIKLQKIKERRRKIVKFPQNIGKRKNR